jgi:hypothetical protein
VLSDTTAAATGLEPIDDLRVAKVMAATAGREPYTIALAGRHPLPPTNQTMVLTGLAEVRKWLELYHEQSEILDGQHRHFQNLREGHEELGLLREELRRSEAALGRVIAEGAELREQLERADRTMAAVFASPSWRITKPLRAFKRLLR